MHQLAHGLPADVAPDLLGLTGTRQDLEAAARLLHGSGLAYRADWAEARPYLARVDGAHALWQVASLGALGMLEAWVGRFGVAEQVGLQAVELARQLGFEDQPATAARVALARVALERGRWQEASLLLDEAEARADVGRDHALAALIVIEQAAVAHAARRAGVGLLILTELAQHEGPCLPPIFATRRNVVEARLLLAIGDLDGARRIVDRDMVVSSELVAERVHIAVEQGDVRAARRLVDTWPVDGDSRGALARSLWLAIIEHHEGAIESSCARLRAVVVAAEAEGDIGLFRSADHLVLEPARELYLAAPTPFLRTIVERPSPPAAERDQPTTRLVDQLTEREFTVLAALPSRTSNHEIAQLMGISLNTVKTHLKHIYRKLGVAGRAEAIAEAERLRLL